MIHITKLVILCVLWLSIYPVVGQQSLPDAAKPSLDNGTIQSQFDYLIEESNKYQDYRVVKRTWLYKLKSHVADSMKVVHNDLSATQQVVSKQKQEISELQSALDASNKQLSEVQHQKNSIQFLGVQTEKTIYKSIMWAIIGILLASLLFFVFKFRRSNTVTTDTKMTLIKIQEEYESYKRRALEKQQQLKRELQDELNKSL